MQLQILQTLRKLKQVLSSEAVGDSPTGNNATQEYGLHVLVKGSRRYFLINSGSAVSVIPTSFVKHQVQPGLLNLYAANAAEIDTYGEVNLELHLNLMISLKWNFVIPNVQSPIIGAHFLSHLTMGSQRKCKGGESFEIILAGPVAGPPHIQYDSSRRIQSMRDITQKLEAAEERRSVIFLVAPPLFNCAPITQSCRCHYSRG
jgi:hypothetical protein